MLSPDHIRYIDRLLQRFRVPAEEREDLRQDILLTVHRNLHQFQERAAFSSWLYAICARAVVKHRRRARALATFLTLEDESYVANMTSETSAAAADQLESVYAALATLDGGKRQLIEAHVLHGYSVTEIARKENCPVQTIYTRLAVARGLLIQAVHDAQ